MPLSPQERRRAEEALRAAAEEGRRAGRNEGLRGVIAARARQVLREDYRRAGEILEGSNTLKGALYHMARLFLPGSVARWRERMRPVVNDTAEAATAPAAEVLGPFDARRPAANDFLERYVSELADRVSETTYGHVMETIREAEGQGLTVPETAKRLRERAGIETPKRAKLIARNELQRITKGAAWAQALESGLIRGKRRHEQHDEKTRDSHRELDGEERAIDEPYSNGELWAGQTDINCRGWDEFLIDYEALEARGAEPPEEPEREEPEELGDPHDEIARVFAQEQISEAEAEAMVERIAERASRRGFDTAARIKAGKVIADKKLEWEGRVVGRDDRLPTDVQHFLKHVLARKEWPAGTDLEAYLASVREVIEDPETGVFVNRFGGRGREQIGFVRRAKDLAGPNSKGWVLVEYVLETGFVHTAFQPEDGYAGIFANRRIVRWLRRPERDPE